MEIGAVTGYIDVAQLVLYAFWGFFAALIIYLHRENKREGYPMESDIADGTEISGFPAAPGPKTFRLLDGTEVTVPRVEAPAEINAVRLGPGFGAPLEPSGDPLKDGVGPAAYAARADHPDRTVDGRPKIVPLRSDPSFSLAGRDPDPRGFTVVGADGAVGGTVSDVWIDRSDPLLRYFEVEIEQSDSAEPGEATSSTRVLVPYSFGHVRVPEKQLEVKAVLGAQFASAPVTASPDQVTLAEEDRISAFYAGGLLYATPERSEPLL
jgi:photosynthetic reaction center H subunit